MSFILDALKKSENERQQQTGGEFSSVPTSSDNPRPARWFWLLAALLAINIAVLLGILMRPDVQSTATSTFDDAEFIAEPTAEPTVADLTPATTPSFADQVQQARRQQPAVAEQSMSQQVDLVAAATTNAATAIPETTAPATTRGPSLPTIEELRLNGSLQLPELHIDIHVYSDNPAERFVFINMAKHREQSQLEEGPVIQEITTDGVILRYQGRSFLLSRE